MKQPSPRPLSVGWIALVVTLCAQAAIHGQLTFDERLSLGDVAHGATTGPDRHTAS